MPDIAKLHNTYVANLARFPALYDVLASQLGVSAESVYATGAGLLPLDEQDNWAWTAPERNAKGEVVGLSKRLANGAKYMVKGSKRGLIYAVNHNTEQYERRQWVRVSESNPCPICGKPDGCLYPEGEHENPNAVICVHISSGSAKPMKLGYLHILDPARQQLQMQGYSLLLPSDHPVLIVEGWTDVCAAYDLGFTAVGKPSAASKSKDLIELLSGRRCVIMGENDAGAGRAGMESTFTQLRKACPDCTKLMPPEGVKDLRQWKEKGLTQAELIEYIEKTGDKALSKNTFDDDRSITIAETWINNHKTVNGKKTFGIYRKGYVGFNGHVYEELDEDQVYDQMYSDISKYSYVHADGATKPYKLTCGKVRDILQACRSLCRVKKDAPSWLTRGEHMDPTRLIVFQNGVLDVNEYIKGNVVLHPPTPDYFTFYPLPYDFDETLESDLWEEIVLDIFKGDVNKVRLLAQWFGLNLVPDMSFEMLMMFLGVTGSGKGTIITGLQAMLGDANCCTASFLSLSGDHGLHPLMGKLSAVVGDAVSASEREERAVLAKLVSIVGGDSVIINPKGLKHLPKVKLCCRFTFAMNDFAAFRDESKSLERRTSILTFNNSYVGRADGTLKSRIEKQALEGKLVNFALRGLKDLYAEGKFVVPEESAIAIHSMRELVSPVSHFAQYCLEPDKDGPGVSTDRAYDLWKWWCDRDGLKKGIKSTLIRSLLAAMPNTVHVKEGAAGSPDRMLMGIKVTEWAETAQGQG